ncbi:DUF1080 domain-containing protein [Bacteroidota bacterium]
MTNCIKYLAIISAGIIFLAAGKGDDKVQLFNGKDLNNWDKVLFDASGVPDEVFQVEDGVIKVLGAPFGYILTKESYSNYKLHVEWRWTAEPANSGVFLHVQELNMEEFPLCIEAQLANSKAGDFVLIGHGAGISRADTTLLISPGEENRYKSVRRLQESSENIAGEWNVYDITCDGNNIELIVNGVVQNNGTQAIPSSGKIALQSEGGPIEFRNIYLTPLKKIE